MIAWRAWARGERSICTLIVLFEVDVACTAAGGVLGWWLERVLT